MEDRSRGSFKCLHTTTDLQYLKLHQTSAWGHITFFLLHHLVTLIWQFLTEHVPFSICKMLFLERKCNNMYKEICAYNCNKGPRPWHRNHSGFCLYCSSSSIDQITCTWLKQSLWRVKIGWWISRQRLNTSVESNSFI